MRRAFLVLAGLMAIACAQERKDDASLAPYVPSPEPVVQRMLEMAEIKPGDKMFDLGSGDGRIVIMAAKKFRANAVGVEFNEERYQLSMNTIRKEKLEKTANVIHGDVMKQDYSSADVITVYLLPVSNDKLRPMLEKQLKKGARVVSHDFPFSDWPAEKIETVDDDGEGRSHTIYLYRR